MWAERLWLFLFLVMSRSGETKVGAKALSRRHVETSPTTLIVNDTAVAEVSLDPNCAANFTSPVGERNAREPYDSIGAISYVVIVMVVYGIAMFALLCSVVKRKPHDRQLDVEIRNYKRGLDEARRRSKQQGVLRTRLSWPGNFIGLRFSARRPCGYASPVDETMPPGGDTPVIPLAAFSAEIDIESAEDSQ